MVVAIVVAAGRSERFGRDKLDLPLAGKHLWRWSVDAFLAHPEVDGVGLVAPAQRTCEGLLFHVPGGISRQESVKHGLLACPDADFVLIHDAARPLVSPQVITRVIEAASQSGAAAPVLPVSDTIRRVGANPVIVPREALRAMQTPQAGRLDELLRAHQSIQEELTDDIGLLEAIGRKVEFVEGEKRNFKITTEEDYRVAQALTSSAVETRTGLGYDVHAFSSQPDRRLMLGGIEFEGPGLEGHSDADVLLHAVVDALLGGAGLGDIGVHFPPSDPQWKDMSSLVFLKKAGTLIEEEQWRVVHIDATVLAERPKIMSRCHEICGSIASALGINPSRVSVKATTHERLGAIGRGEGIAAMAVATLSRMTRGD